jgi:hypothetical protein
MFTDQPTEEPAVEQTIVDAIGGGEDAPVDAAEPVVDDAPTEESEASQVKEMRDWVKVPGWLRAAFERAKAERKYLHTDAFGENDPNAVACNDLLRSIWAKLALVWPQQPEATCKPPLQMDPPQDIFDQAQLEQAQNQMLMAQAQAAGVQIPPDQMPPSPISDAVAQWKQQQQVRERTARTAGGVLNKMAKFAHLEQVAQKAALDALTTSLVWLKTGWQEDVHRDFLGQRRTRNDAQDQLAKLRQMEVEYAAGDFDQQDAKWNQMLELRAYAVRYATKQMESLITRDNRMQAIAAIPAGQPVPPHLLPEPERFQTGTVDVVDLENIRLDWQRVTSPETVHLSRRIAERVWMSRDEVVRVFKLSDEDREQIGRSKNAAQKAPPSPDGTTTDVPNPADDDLEQEERNGADGDIAVWELWDYEQHRIYWFTYGLDKFLRTEIPEVTRRDFFPYIPLFFNPVSGQFMPISDTRLGRKLQDDLNQSLTDDREARIAQYPWYAVGQGLIDKEDIRAIESRKPNKVVVTTKPASEIKSQIVKMDGEDYRPELYQIGVNSARTNMERMLGVPSEALQGQSKAKFATQVQVASDNMLAQSGRNGSAIAELLRQVFEAWMDYAAAAMPAAQVKKWLGPWAEWPEPNRDEMISGMFVEVVSAGNRGQRRQDLEDIGNAVIAINGLADAAMKLAGIGYALDVVPISKRIESSLDVRLPNGLISKLAAPPMQPMAAPAPGGPKQPNNHGGDGRQGLPTEPASTGGGIPGGQPPAGVGPS